MLLMYPLLSFTTLYSNASLLSYLIVLFLMTISKTNRSISIVIFSTGMTIIIESWPSPCLSRKKSILWPIRTTLKGHKVFFILLKVLAIARSNAIAKSRIVSPISILLLKFICPMHYLSFSSPIFFLCSLKPPAINILCILYYPSIRSQKYILVFT